MEMFYFPKFSKRDSTGLWAKTIAVLTLPNSFTGIIICSENNFLQLWWSHKSLFKIFHCWLPNDHFHIDDWVVFNEVYWFLSALKLKIDSEKTQCMFVSNIISLNAETFMLLEQQVPALNSIKTFRSCLWSHWLFSQHVHNNMNDLSLSLVQIKFGQTPSELWFWEYWCCNVFVQAFGLLQTFSCTGFHIHFYVLNNDF